MTAVGSGLGCSASATYSVADRSGESGQSGVSPLISSTTPIGLLATALSVAALYPAWPPRRPAAGQRHAGSCDTTTPSARTAAGNQGAKLLPDGDLPQRPRATWAPGVRIEGAVTPTTDTNTVGCHDPLSDACTPSPQVGDHIGQLCGTF